MGGEWHWEGSPRSSSRVYFSNGLVQSPASNILEVPLAPWVGEDDRMISEDFWNPFLEPFSVGTLIQAPFSQLSSQATTIGVGVQVCLKAMCLLSWPMVNVEGMMKTRAGNGILHGIGMRRSRRWRSRSRYVRQMKLLFLQRTLRKASGLCVISLMALIDRSLTSCSCRGTIMGEVLSLKAKRSLQEGQTNFPEL